MNRTPSINFELEHWREKLPPHDYAGAIALNTVMTLEHSNNTVFLILSVFVSSIYVPMTGLGPLPFVDNPLHANELKGLTD